MTREVTFLLYDGFAAIDATGPADVFQIANELAQENHYRFRYLSSGGGHVRASNNMVYLSEDSGPWRALETSTVMVPGAREGPLRQALTDSHLMNQLRLAAPYCERICSVCSGAFLLAQAGLLDGKRATTHWRGLQKLADAFPAVSVESNGLFVEDAGTWTSAGVTAGIDMALALVERDHGRTLAMKVAKEMVLFFVRPGGQAQFSAPLEHQLQSASSELSGLPFWLEENLASSISVADMAAVMTMSERHFHRRCVATFGQTPYALLQRQRLERARTLLEAGRLSLEEVAKRSGFSDLSALGKGFRQHFGVTPGDYRKHFGQ